MAGSGLVLGSYLASPGSLTRSVSLTVDTDKLDEFEHRGLGTCVVPTTDVHIVPMATGCMPPACIPAMILAREWNLVLQLR